MKFKRELSRWLTPSTRTIDASSGQAIILIGVAALAMIAMLGLAIDGGRLLFLKRETQNAADAAAIAAARAMCLDNDGYIQSGMAAANANGFDDNETDNWVDINVPPIESDITIEAECVGCYVEAIVRAEIPSSFIGIVYDGPLTATSRTVGACDPNRFKEFVYDENGLRGAFSLSDTCETGITVSGATILGGTHANGLLKISPSQGGATVIGPSSYKGSLFQEDKDKVDWRSSENDDGSMPSTAAGLCDLTCFVPDEDEDDEDPDGGCTPGEFPYDNPYRVCEDISDPMLPQTVISRYAPGGDAALAAGSNYYPYQESCAKQKILDFIDSHTDAGGNLDTGLYYFECDISINQFDGKSGNITWVSTGSIHISGGMNSLTAYTDDLLFYADGGTDKCSDKTLKFSGNNNSTTGNMYAPHGEVDYSGSYSEAYGCITGYQVTISGSETYLQCDPGMPQVIGDPGVFVPE